MAQNHPLEHLETILIIGIGGFAGSNLRYFVDLIVPSTLAATLTVNTLGCLALGFLLYEEIYSGTISQSGRSILATGFIASFTTYSTFIIDTLQSAPMVAIGYVAGSYALGFVAVLVGRDGARRVTNTSQSTLEVSK